MRRRLLVILAFVMVVGGLALGLLYLWRSRGRVNPSASANPGADLTFPETGFPGQDIAFANPLHSVHVQNTPAIPCDDCHTYRPAEPEVNHRCLRCHPENWSSVHAAVNDEHARECLSCHDFLHVEAAVLDHWACPACHVNEEYEGPRKLPTAPKIALHAKEPCGDCHMPHGGPAVVVHACLECHKDEATRHADRGSKGAQKCLDCHSVHEPTGAAERHCRKCHKRDVPRRATFRGHGKCVDCHKPHGFTRETAEACTDCHQRQPTLAAAKTREHADCERCHQPHDVKASRSSCANAECHKRQKRAHPPDEQLGPCLGCHTVHPRSDRPRVGTASCASCHAKGQTETAFHKGGKTCRDCHEPHKTLRVKGDARFCRTCHAERAGEAGPIETTRGHSNCADCHGKAGHDPSRPRPACASCHDAQGRSAPKGHDDCATCHTTHKAAVRKQATCTSSACHKRKQWGGRHERIAGGCANCHRAHGPKGVAKPPGCTSCHERSELPGLHLHRDHQKCSDCHQPHDRRVLGRRRACLQGCHEDLKRHEPTAKSCVSCHPFEGAK